MAARLCAIGALLLPFVGGVLPPGYEDELYCAKGACLRPRATPPGYVGPRSAFWECFNGKSGAVTAPRGWGYKLDPQIRHDLIRDGCTTEVCPGIDPTGASGAAPVHAIVQAAEVVGPCQQLREERVRAGLEGSHIPACEPDGVHWKPRQCVGRLCWCVDVATGEQTGTDLTACPDPSSLNESRFSVVVDVLPRSKAVNGSAAAVGARAADGGDSATSVRADAANTDGAVVATWGGSAATQGAAAPDVHVTAAANAADAARSVVATASSEEATAQVGVGGAAAAAVDTSAGTAAGAAGAGAPAPSGPTASIMGASASSGNAPPPPSVVVSATAGSVSVGTGAAATPKVEVTAGVVGAPEARGDATVSVAGEHAASSAGGAAGISVAATSLMLRGRGGSDAVISARRVPAADQSRSKDIDVVINIGGAGAEERDVSVTIDVGEGRPLPRAALLQATAKAAGAEDAPAAAGFSWGVGRTLACGVLVAFALKVLIGRCSKGYQKVD
eukprot:TRINITY_DN14503_c0_g2_i1.p2 TRINITY_DN14503_c0_g2~~TRINITY_DN14503_c0_g2_i1.p2  ORF type:complete len:503 (+),score=140.78 TRINITY_DN14503_c0_g2_i1:70-1578(+)